MEDYSKLDTAEAVSHIFHPRVESRSALTNSSRDVDCVVEDGVLLGCRFHGAAKDAPTIIFFHGNGETVSDYDSIAPGYTGHDMNLLVTTYRGYGWSTGSPSVTQMFKDGLEVFRQAREWLAANGYTGPIFAMGRSLGSTGAIDLASKHQEALKGLIIDSGFSDTLPLAEMLGIPTKGVEIREEDCFNNCAKIEKVQIPTLILHGARDAMIPIALAEKLQACSGARNKQFLVIPGAEHNTMIETAGDLYFQTIKKFIDGVCGKNDWRSRRRKFRQKNNG